VAIDYYDPGSFAFSAPELPGWLNFNSTTKVLSGIPANDDVGENEITLRVTNGEITADTSFIINVINVNDPPVITSEPLRTANTGKQYNYTLIAEDVDPFDELSYSYTQKPAWAGFNQSTGLLSGTPSRDDTGSYNVVLRVSDGEEFVDQTFNIDVEFFNFPPDITTTPKDTVEINNTYTYGIGATDPEGDPISYFVNNKPDWLQFYPDSRVLIGVPSTENAGDQLIVLGATDGLDTTYQAYTLHVVFGTSIKAWENQQNIDIYPNPASTYLNIVIENDALLNGDLYIELSDISGRSVIMQSIRESFSVIELEPYDLTNGMYFYRIFNTSKIGMIKAGKVLIE
jgi:hypothetical protein